MGNTEKRMLFIQNIALLLIFAEHKGIQILPYSYHRTKEEQKKLYDEGKSNCDGTIKVSKHQLWLAMDFVIVKDGALVWAKVPEYETLGKYWESLGQTWGGSWDTSFSDPYHFEHKDAS